MSKLKQKSAPLQKQGLPPKKNKTKVSRSQDRDYVEWFHAHGFECLECGAKKNIEAHHVIARDNKTIVPFCSYCHRGDNRDNAFIVDKDDDIGNAPFCVNKGYYLHRGTRSAEFKKKWADGKLLKIAHELYQKFKETK